MDRPNLRFVDFCFYFGEFQRAPHIKFNPFAGILAMTQAEREEYAIRLVQAAEERTRREEAEALALESQHEAELQVLRDESQSSSPPQWVTLPTQIGACMVFAMLIVVFAIGIIPLAVLDSLIEGAEAIARLLRWSVCS